MRYDNPIVDFWFEEAAKPAETTSDDRQVRAVILEVNLEGGFDVLAAFASGKARFLNRTGDISMWEGGDGPAARLIAELLALAIPIAQSPAEPPDGSPSALPDGTIRLSVFTGLGMHMVQRLADESDGDPIFATCVDLMNTLEGI